MPFPEIKEQTHICKEHFITQFSGTQQMHIQYVAQYPYGTSIRTLKTKSQFLRRPFQLSVNEVFRMKAGHFSFNMKVLAS